MQDNPEVKYMLLLGEVGGTEEYKVIDAIKEGKITKPIIAWCIGTIAKHYSSGVQFGHAGASANAERETADAKNKAMAKRGSSMFRVHSMTFQTK
jgi:ATP-citrate lyase alpha-subunit